MPTNMYLHQVYTVEVPGQVLTPLQVAQSLPEFQGRTVELAVCTFDAQRNVSTLRVTVRI